MELRIVGRPGTEPRLVDLDGPAELHHDDRILGADGEPLGDRDPTGQCAAAGHEPWSYNWVEALERDLTGWLNRNSVDAAVGAPDWELARAVMVQLCAARGPQFPRYFLHGDNHVLPYPGPVPAGWPSA
jgi:hypothetical protein